MTSISAPVTTCPDPLAWSLTSARVLLGFTVSGYEGLCPASLILH